MDVLGTAQDRTKKGRTINSNSQLLTGKKRGINWHLDLNKQ